MEKQFDGTIELKAVAARSREVHTFIDAFHAYVGVLSHPPAVALVFPRTHKAILKAIAEYNKRDGFLTGVLQLENLRVEGCRIEVHESKSHESIIEATERPRRRPGCPVFQSLKVVVSYRPVEA